MQFNLNRDGETAIFVITGQITHQHIDPNRDPLMELAGANVYRQPVLLNLAGVDYLDSSGVSWLLVRHKRCREQGGRFLLFGVTPMVLQILKVLRLEQILTITDDLTSAKQLLAAPLGGAS
jgi:anti-anti-sigma factor